MATKISEYTGNIKGAIARLTGGLVFNKASGIGIKVDTTTPTFPWGDIIGAIEPDSAHPSTTPEKVVFYGNIKAYQFSDGEQADLVFHMPHDYAPGTDLFIHAHWSHNGTGISGDNTLIYRCTYAKRSYTPGTPFVSEVSLNTVVTSLGITNYPQYGHFVDESQLSSSGGVGGLLDTDTIEVDGLIMINFEQGALPTITGGGDNEPFILTIDIHYQSTGIGTKSSIPDYYT